MTLLLLLAGILVALWAVGLWRRDAELAFAAPWIHALLVAAAIVLVMALVAAVT